jgi:SnoaL-like domain
MGQWSRDELAEAFQRYQDQVDKAVRSGDWALFADLFTEDCTYYEHVYGTWEGRDRTRSWIHHTMTTFPGSEMVGFPPAWSTIDEDKGWVICDVRNLMRDPGDGSQHEASNITILHYAGEGLWSHEEDVYNPMHFLTMVKAWCKVADAHGTLSDEGKSWLATYGA